MLAIVPKFSVRFILGNIVGPEVTKNKTPQKMSVFTVLVIDVVFDQSTTVECVVGDTVSVLLLWWHVVIRRLARARLGLPPKATLPTCIAGW